RFEVKHLIYKSTDRATRNNQDYALLEQKCSVNGITRHYYESNTRIGPESHYGDEAMEGIQVVMARMYSAQNAFKVRSAHKELVKSGRYPGGAPWGYVFDGS